MPNLSKGRPRFGKKGGKQVRTLRGIKVGQRYIAFHKYLGAYGLYRILEKPYKKWGEWFVKVMVVGIHGEDELEKYELLDHHSVVPYPSGRWDDYTCFLRTKAETDRYIKERINRKAFQPTYS